MGLGTPAECWRKDSWVLRGMRTKGLREKGFACRVTEVETQGETAGNKNNNIIIMTLKVSIAKMKL